MTSRTAHEVASDVARGRVSAREVVTASLDAIEREQPRLNAFITVMRASALAAAEGIDRRRARREPLGPLAGVPLAVKDLLFTHDAPTTAGSRIYGEGLPAQADAPVVRRLRRAGCVVVGKANLHEVALGVTNVNEHFGAAHNPWDTARVSGGSSGGSAVAVAADLVPLAIGTDTRGSIRIPAAACGITGFKPTYGLVSVEHVIPLAHSLDHVGPMARSVDDAALMLAAMLPPAKGAALLRGSRAAVKRFVIGISEYHMRDLDGPIARALEAALKELRPLVRDLREVRIPELDGVQEASTVLASSEAVAFHDAFLRTHPEGYGPQVRQRMEAGYARTAVEYVRAQQKRVAVQAAFSEAFGSVDLLVGATLPVAPPTIEAPTLVHINGRELTTVEAFTRYNGPQNVAGIPALSVPAGLVKGLPVGLQVMGAMGRDAMVLALGRAWQRHTDWHARRPGGQAARRAGP
ncbi:MAG: amidase [Gemmatimonadetes bacterium]|nr:amidase [Gemmatimonadota bacterium]